MTAQRQAETRAPGRSRRRAILAAATELFAARGYHATGIDDIGEAVDVTGPALYRHFGSKVDILTEVIEGWMNVLMEGVERISAEERPAVETLDLLIDNLVTCTVEAPTAYAVMVRERHHLPKDERRTIDRAHRRHLDAWVAVIREIHPQMSDEEARVLVQGVFGLAAPVTFRKPRMAADELAVLLRAMATEVTRRGVSARRAPVGV
jgi:AcrR family transcriptional regulator